MTNNLSTQLISTFLDFLTFLTFNMLPLPFFLASCCFFFVVFSLLTSTFTRSSSCSSKRLSLSVTTCSFSTIFQGYVPTNLLLPTYDNTDVPLNYSSDYIMLLFIISWCDLLVQAEYIISCIFCSFAQSVLSII